jgi:predicted DNA-binding transcriptional regulator AlpA
MQAQTPHRQAKARAIAPPPVASTPAVVPRTYTQDEVMAMCKNVTWRTIQRWMSDKKIAFPRYKKLGPGVLVFLADEIDAWLIKRLS